MVWFLFYRSRGFAGRLIRWQTRSNWSHVAVVIHLPGKPPTLYEAIQGKGVLCRAVEQADLEANWMGVGAGYTEEDATDAMLWAEAQVGKAYDWSMVLRFVTRRQETRRSRGKWFCSEYAFVIGSKLLVRSKHVMLARTEPWEVSPGFLYRSPLLFISPAMVLR